MNIRASSVQARNHEQVARPPSGWLVLLVTVALFGAAIALFVAGARGRSGIEMAVGVVGFIAAIVMSCGFFSLQPNEGAVLILFARPRWSRISSSSSVANPRRIP